MRHINKQLSLEELKLIKSCEGSLMLQKMLSKHPELKPHWLDVVLDCDATFKSVVAYYYDFEYLASVYPESIEKIIAKLIQDPKHMNQIVFLLAQFFRILELAQKNPQLERQVALSLSQNSKLFKTLVLYPEQLITIYHSNLKYFDLVMRILSKDAKHLAQIIYDSSILIELYSSMERIRPYLIDLLLTGPEWFEYLVKDIFDLSSILSNVSKEDSVKIVRFFINSQDHFDRIIKHQDLFITFLEATDLTTETLRDYIPNDKELPYYLVIYLLKLSARIPITMFSGDSLFSAKSSEDKSENRLSYLLAPR